MNKIRSEQKNGTINRPILPINYYFSPPKKEEFSEKDKQKVLDKFSIQNLQQKNFEKNNDLFTLDLSTISYKDEPPLKYGSLQEIKMDLAMKNNTTVIRRVVHIATYECEAHLENLKIFLEYEKKYKYYFIYVDDGEFGKRFHIQYAPQSPRKLNLEIFAPCEFLEPISYEDFLDLLEKGQLLEVEFSGEKLILSKGGRPKKEEVENLNNMLRKYKSLNDGMI